jgi:NTE family protein
MRWRWPLPWLRPRGLALGLQGGGAHGAFTWGVLDALLEQTDWPIAALSGTSAGAMNAVVLAHGLLEGQGTEARDRARAALDRFWHAVGTQLPFEWVTQGEGADTALTPAARWWLQWARLAASPYQRISLQPDPLRSLLAEQLDFERLQRSPGPALWVAATRADSGRLRLFARHELTVDVLLASACLPQLQPAITIDGMAYWDGGFSANPAVFPLVESAPADDLLLVLLSPWSRATLPTAAAQIQARATEIGFDTAFLREMAAWARASREARQAVWPAGPMARLRRLRWHVIDGDAVLAPLAPESRLIAHRPFLEHLKEAGRARASAWLQAQGPAYGRRSSAELMTLFGERPPGTPA